MKLTLNANSEVARKIAMCYTGHKECDCGYTLIGISNGLFVLGDGGVIYHDSDITIDTDTAKFDPFVAMLEGVPVEVEDVIGDLARDCSIQKIVLEMETLFHIEDEYGRFLVTKESPRLSIYWALQQEGVSCTD